MISMSDIKDQLLAKTSTLNLVGTASDFAGIADGSVKKPVQAFVLPNGEQAGEQRNSTGRLVQLVMVTFAVMISIKSAGARTGARQLDDVKAIHDDVIAALFGWQPPDALSPCLFSGAEVVAFDAKSGVLFYQMKFTTSEQITAQG